MRLLPLVLLSVLSGCAHKDVMVATDAGDQRSPAPSVVAMDRVAARVVPDPPDLAEVPTLLIAQELAARGLVKWGCIEAGTALATWSPPADGSPAVLYRLHVEYCGVSLDTCFTWPIPAWADSVRARVAGVDAELRQGPWSPWSLWYPITED